MLIYTNAAITFMYLMFNNICIVIVGYQLKQVQVFFRHGERIPTSILTFPNDIANLEKNLPYERGEMTNKGMMQEYNLGMKFREIYGEFYGDSYKSLQLKVNSGADNRTLESAQLVMASFLPPKGNQIWNTDLLWRPIPVFSNAIIDDDHCDSLRNTIMNSEGYKNLSLFYATAMKNLELETGYPIPDLYIFQKVLDTIVSRDYLNGLLPLPKWARQPGYLEEIKKLQLGVHSGLADLFLDTIGGWHFDQIYSRIDEFINNRTDQKLIFYSGHDTNILTLGRFFNIEPIAHIMPQYGSALSFELYQNTDNKYFVEVNFHLLNYFIYKLWVHFLENPKSTPIPLEFTDCPRHCELDTFKTLATTRITSEEWMDLCTGKINSYKFYGFVTGSLMILLVLILSLLVSLFWSCCNYKRRYWSLENLLSSQRTPLISYPN